MLDTKDNEMEVMRQNTNTTANIPYELSVIIPERHTTTKTQRSSQAVVEGSTRTLSRTS